jgi:hypothetical protein
MRHHLALLAALCLLGVWACGSDAADHRSAREGSSSAAGGAGTGSSSAGQGGRASAGGAEPSYTNLCEQACAKLDRECGLGDLCAQLPFLSCDMPTSECPAQCVLDADCATIYTLGDTATADPTLMGCLTTCDGDQCQGCVLSSCPDEATACNTDMACTQYLSCLSSCTPCDVNCFDACAAAHDSPITAALVTCAHQKCSTECGLDAANPG